MDQIKRILGSKIFLFLLLLAVIWVGLFSVKAYWRKHQLDQEISALKKEIDKLDKNGQELNQLIKYFNNKDFLTREAKDKLNLKSEGETVVMVPQAAISQELAAESSSTSAMQVQVSSPAVEENNLIKWWQYMFGK